MNHEIACYEKALKKQLRCTYRTKKCLLSQFRSSLDAYLEEYPSPTEADLLEAFGPPEDMAKVLMESLTNTDIVQFEKQRRRISIVAIAFVVLLFIGTVYTFFWKDKPLVVVNNAVEITTHGSLVEVLK